MWALVVSSVCCSNMNFDASCSRVMVPAFMLHISSIASVLSGSNMIKYSPCLSGLCQTLPAMTASPFSNAPSFFHLLWWDSGIGLSCHSDHLTLIFLFLVSAGMTLAPILYLQKSAQSFEVCGVRYDEFVISHVAFFS